MINIKALYTLSGNRLSKSAWRLSVNENLLVTVKNKIMKQISVKLVYLPDCAA